MKYLSFACVWVLAPMLVYFVVGEPAYLRYHQLPKSDSELDSNINLLKGLPGKKVEEWFVLAMSQQARGLHEQAAESWGAALDLHHQLHGNDPVPLYAQVMYLEAMVVSQSGFADRTKVILDKLLAQESTNPKLLLLQSNRLLEEGKWLAARNTALSIMPSIDSEEERRELVLYLFNFDHKLPKDQQLAAVVERAKKQTFSVTVTDDSNIIQQEKTATVFVTVHNRQAQDQQAQGIPIAARKLTVADLNKPILIGPNHTLGGQIFSDGNLVTIKIRISKSQSTQKNSGDIFGESNAIIGQDSEVPIILNKVIN